MLHQLLAHHSDNKKTRKPHARKGLTNIFENENDWTLEVLAPGYHKDDFTMKVEDHQLRIKGTSDNSERKYFRKEFQANEIDRTFKLPKNIEVENISANLEAGILYIVIPKSELAKPKTIDIK